MHQQSDNLQRALNRLEETWRDNLGLYFFNEHFNFQVSRGSMFIDKVNEMTEAIATLEQVSDEIVNEIRYI